MSTKQKEPQTEANAIEQLNSHLTEAGRKVADNKKILYWCVGIILVIAVFVVSYLFIYRNPRLQKSAEAYDKVELKAMGNDSIAAAEYKKVADQYGSAAGGNLAALSAAEAYYNLGKWEQAVKYLDKFDSADPVLQANKLVLEGDCYVNLKKYDQALAAYAKAITESDGNPQITPRVLFKEANVYDAQKKYDKALECYTRIVAEYPEFQPGNGTPVEAYVEREKARLGK